MSAENEQVIFHKQTLVDSAQTRAENRKALIDAVRKSPRRSMKRCFMTGKQCIYADQVSKACVAQEVDPEGEFTTFIAMPFTAEGDAFYKWSLKRYLMKEYDLAEASIIRADDVQSIGNVVCEKICYRIQCSDLFVVDVTPPKTPTAQNANVYYEFGLAYGLERPFTRLVNEDVTPAADFRYAVQPTDKSKAGDDAKSQGIFRYPGLREIPITTNKIADHIFYPSTRPVPRDLSPENQKKFTKQCVRVLNGTSTRDERAAALLAATGVALHEISEHAHETLSKIHREEQEAQATSSTAKAKVSRARVPGQSESSVTGLSPSGRREGSDIRWFEAMIALGKDFLAPEFVEHDSFDSVVVQLLHSFAVVIDLSDNDPTACFWLGYCHACGINAIPVFEPPKNKKRRAQDPRDDDEEEFTRGKGLAFDIRAQWYAEYSREKMSDFKDTVKSILSHLLERELLDRQKQEFWRIFTPQRPIKVFTGLVHNDYPSREMVGDWDVRTVSELFSHLSAIREAKPPELAKPIFSPDEAYKASGLDYDAFVETFNESIEEELSKHHAIVIATADVNPLTEYLLHQVYKCDHVPFSPVDVDEANLSGYCCVKTTPSADNQKQSSVPPITPIAEPTQPRFQRVYCQPLTDGIPIGDEGYTKMADMRGFAALTRTGKPSGDRMLLNYKSQYECGEGSTFELFGHLLVKQQNENILLLLMGVSGPATFALAQILTGGNLTAETNTSGKPSEDMLKEINKTFKEHGSAEAIIRIKVEGSGAGPVSYADRRTVVGWQFEREPHAVGSIPQRNVTKKSRKAENPT